MKTKMLYSILHGAKYVAFMTGLLIFSASPSFSQDQVQKSSAFYPSFGIAIGFFYPGDVNDYIEWDLQGYEVANEDMYEYFDLRAGLTYRIRVFEFTAALEYSIAPKFVVGNNENVTYVFSRVAPEISFNYFIPNKSGKHAFFLGAGVSYNFLKFEDFEAAAPGFKAQLGYSLQFGRFNLQPYGAFRYTKGTDTGFDLNYTGGQIGVILSFHDKILYK